MTRALPIRGGVVWRPSDGDLIAGLAGTARARADRAERLGAIGLGLVGRLLGPESGSSPNRAIGVAVGTAFGCFATNAAYQRRLRAGGAAGASPRLFAATVSNAAAGEVSIAHGLGGPALTVSAGLASGLAALEVARNELLAGDVEAMVVAALDAVDADVARWMATAGWPASVDLEGAAGLVIGDAPDEVPVTAWLGGVATGRTGDADHRGIGAVVTAALDQAGRSIETVAVVASRGRDVTLVGAAIGRPVASATTDAPLAAGGLAALLSVTAARPDPVALVDVCPSGHVAAAVAWRAST